MCRLAHCQGHSNLLFFEMGKFFWGNDFPQPPSVFFFYLLSQVKEKFTEFSNTSFQFSENLKLWYNKKHFFLDLTPLY